MLKGPLKFVMCLAIVMTAVTARAQGIKQTVTGKVTEAESEIPLPGAAVIIEGTSIGIVTNLNGEYSIKVPSPNTILKASFIGYQEEPVAVISIYPITTAQRILKH